MNRTNFEQVRYGNSEGVKPIVTNLVFTYPHWHNETEIVFSCRGELLLEYGGIKRILRQGEIALINPAKIHAVNSVDSENDRENIVCMLQLSGQFFRTMSARIDSLRFSDRIEGPEAEEIKKYLFLIMDEEQNKREERSAVIYGFCGLVAALLVRHFSEKIPPESRKNEQSPEYNRSHDRLKKILSFINEHFAESPSLNDAAKTIYVSPYYFSHFFTQAMGMTYLQYINYVKITMAKQSLATTDDAVINILSRCGFSNAKTFNRVFKEIVGCSPSDYRKFVYGQTKIILPSFEKTHLGSYVNFHSPITIPQALYRPYDGEQGETERPEGAENFAVRNIEADINKSAEKLNTYFRKMVGTARASDFLRKEVQEQFRSMIPEIGFEYVRFPGIFDDTMCVVREDGRFNWRYIDDVLDFLMELHVRPFIELSFMPSLLASGKTTMFYYRVNITPPRNMEKWGDLIGAFMAHIVSRYTLEEVKKWYFEVWNEPNLPAYWSGGFDAYLRLYRTTVTRIKSVSKDIKTGGPALSSFRDINAESFLRDFLRRCAAENIPLDFVSGHPYPIACYEENGRQRVVFCDSDSTGHDMRWFGGIVREYFGRGTEIHFDEWNSSPHGRDPVHDTAFMAVFLLHNYINCRNIANSLCYWSVTDRFEEHGLDPNEFHGGFGLVSMSGFKKPQYYAFSALFALGEDVLSQGKDYIVTYSPAKAELQVLCWNYVHYNRAYANGGPGDFYERYKMFNEGRPRRFRVKLAGLSSGDYLVERTVFNRAHGSVFDFWLKNGALASLSPGQCSIFRSQCRPEIGIEILKRPDSGPFVEETVEPFGFTLLKLRPIAKNEN
ncbi:MAG: helix-turn-helix domain-containing protein [Treponema sp.]|jgi:xylan 1,4-beta-xylosidase|nr:helix-turn-helix domain-containing protein [Treponema sp.]